MEHDFITEKIKIDDGTEYAVIYCRKCGIVSYDQRYASKSYKSQYKVSECLGKVVMGKENLKSAPKENKSNENTTYKERSSSYPCNP